jgi:hypothetical protein
MSLSSCWGRYAALEAARRMPPQLRWLPSVALMPLLGWFQLARLDRAVLLDNWPISTNLRPNHSSADWQQACEFHIARRPWQPLAIRNLCEAVNPGQQALLAAAGWTFVPSRLVYVCDPTEANVWRHNHVRKDRRLIEDTGYTWQGPKDILQSDLPDLRRLFRQVFIEKHSALNPDFSDQFFKYCLDTRYLELYGLRHGGRWVGVIGLLQREGWLTTPLIGYDTSLPQTMSLYRRLMALLLEEARHRNCRLHYSAGAGKFKQARGGQPALEYHALYDRHLPRQARYALAVFATIMRHHAPSVLQRYG